MPNYNFRYVTAQGAMLRMESLKCDSDEAAIEKAVTSMRDPNGLVEVWRAELVYLGTGSGGLHRAVPHGRTSAAPDS